MYQFPSQVAIVVVYCKLRLIRRPYDRFDNVTYQLGASASFLAVFID